MKKATPDQFADTRFRSAAEKAKFVNQLLAFIETGFEEKKFYESVYEELHLIFGHIAHYNKTGFYDEWFSSDTARLRWLRHVMTADIYPHTDCYDVETYIKNHIASSPLSHIYRCRVDRATEAREREELARLKAKYETPASGGKGLALAREQYVSDCNRED